MKIAIDKKRLKIYLQLALAFLLLMLFIDLMRNPETFLERVWNNIWLTSYITVLNYILFEYTLPFIKLTLIRILLAPVLLWAHLMLYSFGLYGWRQIGIELHLYFPLIIHPSILKGVEYHVPYGKIGRAHV